MRTVIVMPAYEAEKTVRATVLELPPIYEKIFVCDDASLDKTYEVSQDLGVMVLKHEKNQGYGANQKTLYEAALQEPSDIIVMVHPDHQYKTDCLREMVAVFSTSPETALIMGSRMKTALKNSMPWWKYLSNRFLSFVENRVFGLSLSEFHSGLRAYRTSVLKTVPYKKFSNDFVFDSEMIAWFAAHKKGIDEVETECYYRDEVSSINFKRSVVYGLSTLKILYRFCRGYYNRL